MPKFKIRKIFTPIVFFFISVFLCVITWDLIKLPFNASKAIYGDSYHLNSYNSLNDTLRFLIFIFCPLMTYILSKCLMNKDALKNITSFFNFNYTKNYLIFNNSINQFFYFFVVIVLFEFFLNDFSKLNYQLDIFHDGLWLTASSNLNIKNEIFTSSYVGRGLYGNFHPYFLWQIIGFESIGVTRFFSFFINLLVKLFCLLIVKKITIATGFKKNEQIIFFIILSLIFLSFTSYGSPVFYDRTLIVFIFIFFVLNYLFSRPNSFILIIVGLFSALSMFWYIDIGIYINFFLLIFLIFLLIKKEFKNFSLTSTGIVTSWLICFYIFSPNELDAFVKNTIMIFSTIEQIHGLIYPTPFSSGTGRSTKALILFLTTGVLIANLLLKNKKNNFFLIGLVVLFVFSVLLFKYGLSRSDGVHIRIASGLITTTFFTVVIFHLVSFFSNIFHKTKNYNKNLKSIISILILITFFSPFFEKKKEIKNIKNINTFLPSVEQLIKSKDEIYLNSEYVSFIKYYRELSQEDNCVFIFTGEIALPYLLKKQTCSKHYINYISSPKKIQQEIIQDLTIKKPEYILYKSDTDVYYDNPQRLKYVNKFIKKNYTEHTNFKTWEIYKINAF